MLRASTRNKMIALYFLSLLLLLYYFYVSHYNYWKSRKVPHDKPVFLFGSFYNIATRKEHIFERLRTIYDAFSTPYVGIHIFHQPFLLIRSPKILKRILVKDFNKFPNRNIASNEAADPLAFHALFIARDSIWRNMRAKISPVFTSGKMKLMFPLMQDCARDLYAFVRGNVGGEIEIKMMMKKYTVDVISSCAFGINTHCFREEDSEILKVATKFVDIFKLTFGDKPSCDYLFNVFTTTLHERETKKIVRNDLIDLLINLRKVETITDSYRFDDEIKMAGQALPFFSAGNDTTSVTLSLTCYELALNTNIQDRLRREVTDIFNEHGAFNYENVQQMKYMDMVLNETLRKYPLAPFLIRQADVDYTFEETGFTLEKDISIIVPISGLHYDPEYYPEPEKYDPERFSYDNVKNLVPYTYLPFGEGPRNCIGQRFALLVSKVALSAIIKDFVFEPTDGTPVPLRFDPGALFVQNKGGLNLKVTRNQ